MSKKIIAYALSPIVIGMLSASPAHAMTDDEIEKRFADYEKKIVKLKKRSDKKDARNSNTLNEMANRLKINGFATAGITTNDDDNHVNTFRDSKVGLQMDFKINDDFNFVTQLTSKAAGGDNWNTEASWAYLKYQFNDDLSLRAGKLRLPYYIASEYIDVGYAYVWTNPPRHIYNPFLSNYTGFDATYTMDIAGWITNTKVYYGKAAEEDVDLSFSIQDMAGIEIISTHGNWLVRAGYTDGGFGLELDAEPGFDPDALDATLTALGSDEVFQSAPGKGEFEYITGGLQYDNGNLLLSAEGQISKIAGVIYDVNSYVVTSAYRFGKWTPYATYSKAWTTNNGAKEKAITAIEGEVPVLEATKAQLEGGIAGYQAALANAQTMALTPAVGGADVDAILRGTAGLPTNITETQVAAQIATWQDQLAQVDGGIAGYASLTDNLNENMPEETSIGAGVRYDINSNVSVKLGMEHFYDFADDTGTNDIYTFTIDSTF